MTKKLNTTSKSNSKSKFRLKRKYTYANSSFTKFLLNWLGGPDSIALRMSKALKKPLRSNTVAVWAARGRVPPKWCVKLAAEYNLKPWNFDYLVFKFHPRCTDSYERMCNKWGYEPSKEEILRNCNNDLEWREKTK